MNVTIPPLVLCSVLFLGCGNEAFFPAGSQTDGGPSDAQASQDGTADGSKPFCTSLLPAPAFCADFDGPNILTAYVYGQPSNSLVPDVDVDAGAGIDAEPSGLSLPNALVSQTPVVATNGVELRARLHQKQSASKSHFHVAFDFRLDAYEQKGIRLFELHAEGPGLVVQWDIVAGGGLLHGNSSAPTSSYSATTIMPPAGPSWNHVDVDVALTTMTATMSLVVNDNVPGKVSAQTNVLVGTAAANFDIGLLAANPASAARVSYDNVVYTEE